MIVVSDTSPLIVLAKIDCLFVLPAIFGTVAIPEEVAHELANGDDRVGSDLLAKHIWLQVRSTHNRIESEGLGAGESAALGLARDLATRLLIDEKLGRKTATELGIPNTGTIGILETAADRGLIDLGEAFERIKRTDFRISHRFLDERLEGFRFRASQGNTP